MKTKQDHIRSLIDQINAQKPTFTGSIRAVASDGVKADAPKTFEISISSEAPYERWFGVEVLGHKSNEVDMAWLTSGNAPLLLQHDHNQQIGVISAARLEGGRVTASVRFGRSALAREIQQDVEDEIRTNVSVGYRVDEMVLVRQGKEAEPDEYRITKWRPHEASVVSVPADQSVGTNRAANAAQTNPTTTKESNTMNAEALSKKAIELGLNPDASLESVFAAERAAGSAASESQHKSEMARRDTITAFGKTHKLEADAQRFIADGKSAEAFQQYVLQKYSDGHTPLKQIGDFSKSEQKDLSKFSIVRAMRALADGDRLTGIEAEVCRLGMEEAKLCGITGARGNSIMLPSVMLRATAMSTGSNAGGEFVPTIVSPNVIDTLRNRMIFGRMGGKILTGLAGNLDLPKVTTSPSGSSVAEAGALSDATIATAEINLSPKRIGATLPYSKQLFLQSSPDVDAFVTDQLLQACALRTDWLMINGDGTTAGHWYGLLNYSGVGSVDSGTDGKQPTLADIIGLETAVSVANADVDNLFYLTSAKGRGMLKQTAKVASTDSVMLWSETNMVNGYKGQVSNQIPQNVTKGSETTNTTSIIFGNFNAAIIGFFGGQEVIVDPYTLAKNAQVQVTVNMFADGDIETPGSFAVMSGVHQS